MRVFCFACDLLIFTRARQLIYVFVGYRFARSFKTGINAGAMFFFLSHVCIWREHLNTSFALLRKKTLLLREPASE